MCGIAGFVDPNACLGAPGGAAESVLATMARQLVHRGPDDEGVFLDQANGVGLAFRRLAILDLSPAGRQPMPSARGRFVIAFNGEVYDHARLRDELAARGHAFNGRSDTETMLAAFEEWGVERAIERFEGMFAFAVLDRAERLLWLVRDRFGVKPLYFGFTHGFKHGNRQGVAHPLAQPSGAFGLPSSAALLFASELKALRACPALETSIDRGALRLFMRYGYVPGPFTIHPEVRKLRPGHLLRVDLAGGRAEERCWWHSREAVRRAAAEPFAGSDADAIDAVDRALLESVRLRMAADVPLGAFLSGGIDSSAVVAAMQAQSSRPVRTFSIGFDAAEFDEAPHARAVARHLGTDHTEVYVTADEALATIPRLATVWDEPFADSSQIPTLLVSEIARRSVTVALSGDGGDEIFGGYYRYSWAESVARRSRALPAGTRTVLSALLRRTPRDLANRSSAALSSLLPARYAVDRAGDRAHKLAELLGHGDPWSVYLDLVAVCREDEALVPRAAAHMTALNDPGELVPELDIRTRMMQADIASYLVDDILVKVDRASMAASLEAREPLLDSRLAELAFRLPISMKIRDGERKWVLRRVLERRVPRALFDRPKMGFGVPLARWLRGPLRGWAEELLAPDRIAGEGHLDAATVSRIWARTLDPTQGSNGFEAWNILMFQSWLGQWGSRAGSLADTRG